MADVSFNSLLNGTAPAGQSFLSSLTGAPAKAAAEPQAAPVTASDKQTSSGANSSATTNSASSTAQQSAAAPSNGASPSTQQSAAQMLSNVDATLAKYQGANAKAPANHQERVKAVAQVANGLKGAEKTAFLEKIQSQGKEFGMNFGQKSIDDKSAFGKLDGEHQAVNLQLQEEAKTGNKAGETTKMVANGRLGLRPQAEKKEATPQGVANTKGMSDDVADLLTRINQQTAEETRAMVAGWDATADSRIAGTEVTAHEGGNVGTWSDMKRALRGHNDGLSVNDMTKMLREKAAAYGEQMKSEAASTSAS